MRAGRPAVMVWLMLAAFVVGSGLAALPYNAQDPCLSLLPADLQEGASWSSATTLWPLGIDCRYEGAAPVHLGPGWGAILGWAVAALAVGALALKRRRRPAARGAAGALVLFGLLGWIVTFGGVVPAAVFALVLGLPLLTSVDAALRPADERDPGASLVIATTLLGVVLVAWVAGAWFGLEAAATIVGCAVAAVLAAVLEGRMQGAPQLG